MKATAISKVFGNADGRGMATDALTNIPDGGKPAELPENPEVEANGPPEFSPPVETGGAPVFDTATGLPMIAMENSPEGFPGQAENDGEAYEVLDFLF